MKELFSNAPILRIPEPFAAKCQTSIAGIIIRRPPDEDWKNSKVPRQSEVDPKLALLSVYVTEIREQGQVETLDERCGYMR